MDLSSFREDLDKHETGAPLYLGDACFYVRRWGTSISNKKLKSIRNELFGPSHRAQPDDDDRIRAEWLLWACTGWKDLSDGKQAVPYSENAKINIFTNPEYYLSLNLELVALAMRFEFYLHDEMREDEEEIKKP